MSSGFDYRKFYVMYVDDEAQSLKYFQKNFEKDFRIVTAENTDAALEILARDGQEIGVLMTDQRMPGASGTELLNQTKELYPEITRILATAYSDLDTAVDSVNEGGAFRYLTKPWNMRELKGVLLRAMEFFLLQRDRNQLVRDKMLVSQRIITMDRLRSMATFLGADSSGCPQLASGLQGYAVTATTADCSQVQLDSYGNTDLWNLTRRESVRLIQAMQQLQTPVSCRGAAPTNLVDWRITFDQCAGQYPGVGDQLNVPAGVTTQCDPKLASVLADCLLRACSHFPESRLQVKDENGAAAMQAVFQLGESPDRVRDLFAVMNGEQDLSADLLDAFLATAAMGGSTVAKRVDPKALQVIFDVGKDSAATPSSGFDVELFERMFSAVEEA